jgi:hypothetical protein
MSHDEELDEADGALTKITSQKPYSPSPNAALLRTMIRRPAILVADAHQ